MKLSKSQRLKVFNKYGGKCAYCGCELQKGWHADHIKPVVRDFNLVKGKAVLTGKISNPELDIIENINPSCSSCNLYKGSMSIEAFRNLMQQQARIALKKSKNVRFAVKYGLIQITDNPVVFYYENFSSQENIGTNVVGSNFLSKSYV